MYIFLTPFGHYIVLWFVVYPVANRDDVLCVAVKDRLVHKTKTRRYIDQEIGTQNFANTSAEFHTLQFSISQKGSVCRTSLADVDLSSIGMPAARLAAIFTDKTLQTSLPCLHVKIPCRVFLVPHVFTTTCVKAKTFGHPLDSPAKSNLSSVDVLPARLCARCIFEFCLSTDATLKAAYRA